MVVVLPEPLGPSRPKISPRWTVRLRALQGDLFLPAPEIAIDLGQLARFDNDVIGHEAASSLCTPEEP